MMKCIFKRMSLWYLVQLHSEHLKTHPFPTGGETELPAHLDHFQELTCQNSSRGFSVPLTFTLRKRIRSHTPSMPTPLLGGVTAGEASAPDVYMTVTQNYLNCPYLLAPLQEHCRASLENCAHRSQSWRNTALHGTQYSP